jgi:hypothetical protein
LRDDVVELVVPPAVVRLRAGEVRGRGEIRLGVLDRVLVGRAEVRD